MSNHLEPRRGDVESVKFADTEANERVAIRLIGHPRTYIVLVDAGRTGRTSGPEIAELTIVPDDGTAVDYAAVREIPVRRLAYSARQWIMSAGGKFGTPGDYSETRTRPEIAASAPNNRLGELHWRIEQAIMDGLPVRKTLAHDLSVSTATLDRMISKAKAEGLLEGVEIPRRPQPRLRYALLARTMLENWLTEHGPNVPMPPDKAAELDRLRALADPDSISPTVKDHNR